jgi:ATP:dephospho-CoA triphosphoribosyl transferase
MDLRREILRNIVLCQALEPLARKPHLEAASSGPKLEYFLVAGVNSAWPFYDLADRVLTAGRQPDCIFDVAYEAQSASVRNRYGGKINFGQISMLVPLVTAQILDYMESGTHEDIDSILARTGDVLRNTTEKDVEALQKFLEFGNEVATRNRERTGSPKPSRTPVLQGRYTNVWDTCLDRQQILMVREMIEGYPHCLQVYRFLLHNLETGIVPASALIHHLLLAELSRPDVVADVIAVGIYLVLTKHPESVLFT